VGELDPQHDLAPIGRVGGERLLLVAAVNRLAEPEPLETAAVGEADRARELGIEEIGDRELEDELFGIEARRHALRSIGSGALALGARATPEGLDRVPATSTEERPWAT
jgi:hypothetical protein